VRLRVKPEREGPFTLVMRVFLFWRSSPSCGNERGIYARCGSDYILALEPLLRKAKGR